jgi:RES domain-containing protein
VSQHAWRIVKQKRAATILTGEGAARFGGRWNSRGVPMVYTAASQALAALEMLVHMDDSGVLHDYVVTTMEIDESLITNVDRKHLPPTWRDDPPSPRTRAIGDAWVRSGSSAVFQVPSTIIPSDNNFLLNPRHPDFPNIRFSKTVPFQFDPRLY